MSKITEGQLDVVKKMILAPSEEGWKAMAFSIVNDVSLKEQTLAILKEIAGTRQLIFNQKFTKLYDIFSEKLEYHIAVIEATEKV